MIPEVKTEIKRRLVLHPKIMAVLRRFRFAGTSRYSIDGVAVQDGSIVATNGTSAVVFTPVEGGLNIADGIYLISGNEIVMPADAGEKSFPKVTEIFPAEVRTIKVGNLRQSLIEVMIQYKARLNLFRFAPCIDAIGRLELLGLRVCVDTSPKGVVAITGTLRNKTISAWEVKAVFMPFAPVGLEVL